MPIDANNEHKKVNFIEHCSYKIFKMKTTNFKNFIKAITL